MIISRSSAEVDEPSADIDLLLQEVMLENYIILKYVQNERPMLQHHHSAAVFLLSFNMSFLTKIFISNFDDLW